MVGPGGPAGIGDRAELSGTRHVEAGILVEHHPDGLSAPEDGGSDRRGPGKRQADLGRSRHGRDRHGSGRRGLGLCRSGRGGRLIQIQPDRPVRRAGAGIRPLGQGQDQFGAAPDGPGLNLFHASRWIDLEPRYVRRGGRTDADDDVAAVPPDLRPGTDDTRELDPGEFGVGTDADRDRIQRCGGLLGQRCQGREQHRPRRGGGHGGLEHAFSGGGPGHTRAYSREGPFRAVNGS